MLPAISFPALLLAGVMLEAAGPGGEPGAVILRLGPPAASGLVLTRIDLAPFAGESGPAPLDPSSLRAVAPASGRELSAQFIPDPDFDGKRRAAGLLLLDIGGEPLREVRLERAEARAPGVPGGRIVVRGRDHVVTHDATGGGGLPRRIVFPQGGKTFDAFSWNDRVFHKKLGGFSLRNDRQATAQIVSQGPLAAVVRVTARYVRPDGSAPPSRPRATYDWMYLRDSPLVRVQAVVRQDTPFAWDELHFLELDFPGKDFPRWAGGEPEARGEFQASRKTHRYPDWAALVDGTAAVGVVDGGTVLLYDGRGGYGTYLHARGDAAWGGWRKTDRRFAAWLWIGSAPDAVEAVRAASKRVPRTVRGHLTTTRLRDAISGAWRKARTAPAAKRCELMERLLLAERLESLERPAEARRVLDGRIPPTLRLLDAGDLQICLEGTPGGWRLLSLADAVSGRQWLPREVRPLFSLQVRDLEGGKEATLTAQDGWKEVDAKPDGRGLLLRFRKPFCPPWEGIAVELHARPDAASDSVRWKFRASNDSSHVTIERAGFSSLALAPPQDGCILFPRGPGEVQRGIDRRAFRYQGLYPSGWTSMQFLACYGGAQDGGLYVGMHDPLAGTKNIRVESRPELGDVLLMFEHPAPDASRAGNDVEIPGEAVWRLFRGDWFDAAVVYRDWVRASAPWFPELGPDGRPDTPAWMQELPVWALGGGLASACVPPVAEFARFLKTPAGFHWYNWHRIPFDNDYPHYFPAKDGFASGVRELQEAGVRVMPYINGRLWDTRDKGTEDFEFTSKALAAATKDLQGSPYVEMYGSKEADGSRVRLAVMCPSTRLWQDRVRGIVLRLFNESGVDAVYIDQIAAAAPRLCFDASHGHPLGGGHWWVKSYQDLLQRLRKPMPAGRVLTTECNAEPYLRWIDGYLTWHWQYDGQVPAFPAVYGGAVQMFGRAYRGGSTRSLALRMKAGQQLVFGEQIGWIDPAVLKEKEDAAFLRQVVALRWKFRRFFRAGGMCRPPRLEGDVPQVRADWQWSGEWWVSTRAVLTGAWRLPRSKETVLFFVNVSDRAVSTGYRFDGEPEVRGKLRLAPREAIARPAQDD